MKKNRIAQFGIALAIATVGLGIAAQPGFAVEGNSAVTTTPTITKVENVNPDEYIPAQTFEFVLDAGDTTGLNTELYKAGKAEDFTIPAIKFEQAEPSKNTTRKGTSTIKLPEDYAQKHEPGIYVYKLTEKNGGYKGVTYDKNEYRLFVQVDETADGKAVKAVWTALKDGTNKTDAKFTNSYTYSETPDKPGEDPHTHNLTVKKVVKGNTASKNDDFEFTVAAAKTSNSSSKSDVYTVVTPNGTVALTAGESVKVSIKADQQIVIKGVTAGDQITVTETDPSSAGYTVKYEDGENVTFADGNKDQSSTVTNFKNNTPTGLFLQYGPFVVMIAAAGALVAVSKKRSDR